MKHTVVSHKKKITINGKSFRLLDFNIYDRNSHVTRTDDDSHISDESSSKSKSSHTGGIESNSFILQMFGINERGETCAIFVDDFKPFFYVRVSQKWTDELTQQLYTHLRSEVGRYFNKGILSATLVEYNKLYGFTAGKQDKFVRFEFVNMAAFNKTKNLILPYSQNGAPSKKMVFANTTLELYESKIPPLLRYFHIKNISPSGWVFVSTKMAKQPLLRTTTCTYEYVCLCSDIIPQNEKETRVPYKICSFDIEASSSHGDFPIPVKTYKRLAANLVDGYNGQGTTVKGTVCDNTRQIGYVSNAIKAAFGYWRCDDIDRVYPKVQPSKECVCDLICILLEKSLDSITESDISEISNIITIENIFEQMKEHQMNYSENDISDETPDDPDTTTDISSHIKKKKTSPKNIPSKLQKRKNGLMDILQHDDLDRDKKVQIINERLLSIVLPRLEGDKATFIGSTFMRYGEPEPYLNHCIVLDTCDPVAGAVIESVATERELLVRWTALIQAENPDIIIGYNIFGFDYEFLFRRAQENYCVDDFFQLSRKIGESCINTNRDTGELDLDKNKVVLATGEYELRYPKMSGRLQIDLYTYFRRDFNFSSYKLDDVAGQLISDDIKIMKHTYDNMDELNPITELYTQNIMGLHVGDFIHLEITTFTSNYLRDGHKFPVLNIIRGYDVVEMVKGVEQTTKYNIICIAGHEAIDMTKHVKWGMAKDDVSPQDIFRLSAGSAVDRARVAKYCIQDCNLVHHLMNKIDVLTGYIEMSKICSVPISFLVFRGQGIKLTSYVAKKCREKNTLMPDLDRSNDFDGYEGAIVLPPKCSMYMDNPVACVDYASLYPSSMISQNYSHDSKVWSKEYDLEGELVKETGEKDRAGKYIYDNLPEYQYIDIKFDSYKYMRNPAKPAAKAEKTKVGWIVCRWAQLPDNKKSIMPAILEELLKARSDTRKMAKTEKDPFMQNILDKRQLGYKVTANSLYGQCGSRTSTFYEKDVAASTTATGREMIMYAKKIIENVYGDLEYETKSHGPVLTKAEYVYGDSVANYTPVIVRVTNAREIVITTIEELATKYGGNHWTNKVTGGSEPGKQEKEICELTGVESWTEAGWTKLCRVIRHTLAPHKKMIRVLTHTGLVDVTDDHSLVRADGTEVSPKDVSVGTELLHHSCQEYTDTSGYTRTTRHKYFDNMVDAAKYTNYLHSQNIPYIIHCNNQSNEIAVYLTSSDEPNTTVRRLDTIPYKGYVYDLTTENHHFAAGVGNLIVHNTDSVFFTFNLIDPTTQEPIRGKKALEITIEIAQDAAHLCTKFLKAPMELAYEKTMMPFILLSKKRYVGMLYETDANKGKMKYMGLSIKRRDSCDYLKDTYGDILNILMKEHNVEKAIQYLSGAMGELVAGNVPMDKLTLTKALRGYYKNPQTIAHSVLADRIGQRDPGNKPKPGDRMKFAFIVNPKPKALLGEKIETPEYIVDHRLTLDYTYYITNQLMKPLQQLFGLALVDIWTQRGGKQPSINAYKKEMAKLTEEYGDDLETFMKKKEKYCAAKVKQLLFDSTLEKIYNKKHGIQTLDTVFGKAKR